MYSIASLCHCNLTRHILAVVAATALYVANLHPVEGSLQPERLMSAVGGVAEHTCVRNWTGASSSVPSSSVVGMRGSWETALDDDQNANGTNTPG